MDSSHFIIEIFDAENPKDEFKTKKSKNGADPSHGDITSRSTKTRTRREAGQEGVEKIEAFLEKIRIPPDQIQDKAREIWEEWLKTGHWWRPSDQEIFALIEGEI